ncbi:hypothetical protein N7463_000487 [Penicillium fimorum]|uniref:Uncharacterized protein n=1 Tax=Penicillium fimorum TaxID=1882269 RepID=A0A9X0CB45_9EURO|nr:hypothetical protein N7463_000487 [Penicillium fimorum]
MNDYHSAIRNLIEKLLFPKRFGETKTRNLLEGLMGILNPGSRPSWKWMLEVHVHIGELNVTRSSWGPAVCADLDRRVCKEASSRYELSTGVGLAYCGLDCTSDVKIRSPDEPAVGGAP